MSCTIASVTDPRETMRTMVLSLLCRTTLTCLAQTCGRKKCHKYLAVRRRQVSVINRLLKLYPFPFLDYLVRNYVCTDRTISNVHVHITCLTLIPATIPTGHASACRRRGRLILLAINRSNYITVSNNRHVTTSTLSINRRRLLTPINAVVH